MPVVLMEGFQGERRGGEGVQGEGGKEEVRYQRKGGQKRNPSVKFYTTLSKLLAIVDYYYLLCQFITLQFRKL